MGFRNIQKKIKKNTYLLCFVILGAKSIERFRKIESASGVDFYQEVGFLSIAPKFENQQFFDQQDYQKVDKMEPLSWPQNCEAIFQPQNAGHISPRNLVKAQKVLAGKNNCQIISDALVTKITKPEESCNGFYTIICKRQNCEKEVRYFLPYFSKDFYIATLAPLLIANSFESGPGPTPCLDKLPLH